MWGDAGGAGAGHGGKWKKNVACFDSELTFRPPHPGLMNMYMLQTVEREAIASSIQHLVL